MKRVAWLVALVCVGCGYALGHARRAELVHECRARAVIEYRADAKRVRDACPAGVAWEDCPGASELDARLWDDLGACE